MDPPERWRTHLEPGDLVRVEPEPEIRRNGGARRVRHGAPEVKGGVGAVRVVDDATKAGRPDALAVAVLRRVVRPLVRVAFRPTIEGLERLPRDRPFLLVANHSAGVGLAEILAFASLYVQRFGAGRPLAGFAHPIGFRVWPLSWVLRRVGAVPSTYDAAHAALAAGVPLLVFPGGDHETLRPLWQAGRVDFGGRKGFLRIARRAGVPIVPMGIRGSHLTAPVLVRSRALAWMLVLPRLMGLKRWGVSVLGLAGAAILAALPVAAAARAALLGLWLASPLVFLPFVPWTIRFRVGPPIEADALFGDDTRDDARRETDDALEDALDRVQRAVQALVDR
jgi:1-acyl-sn-glycerol-3-phosphate acyltransferase